MRATSLNNTVRSYSHSSSFKVTVFTYVLLAILLCAAFYSFRYFYNKPYLSHVNAVLEAEKSYLQQLQNCDSEQLHPPFINNLPNIDLPRFSHEVRYFYGDNEHYALTWLNCKGDMMPLAINISVQVQQQQRLLWLNGFSMVIILLLMLTLYLIGRFVVKGTNSISHTAEMIMQTGDLSQRINVDNQWDDLSSTTVVLNSLLARIEALMQGVKLVSDNIAHDLRTPLTRLRNKIERLDKEHNDLELSALVEEVDSVINTFNSLLRISRIETEQQRSHFDWVVLNELLDDLVHYYEPLAEDKDINIDTHLVDIRLKGDKDLLFQLFANVLDNAIKFTPKGGHISVRLQKGNNICWLEISDSGPGIATEDLDKVKQRFYRADKARNPDGTGLGLSLANAVVVLHKGSMTMNNDNVGLRVKIGLPLAQ